MRTEGERDRNRLSELAGERERKREQQKDIIYCKLVFIRAQFCFRNSANMISDLSALVIDALQIKLI